MNFMRDVVPQFRAGAGLLLPAIAVLVILVSVFTSKACHSGRNKSATVSFTRAN